MGGGTPQSWRALIFAGLIYLHCERTTWEEGTCAPQRLYLAQPQRTSSGCRSCSISRAIHTGSLLHRASCRWPDLAAWGSTHDGLEEKGGHRVGPSGQKGLLASPTGSSERGLQVARWAQLRSQPIGIGRGGTRTGATILPVGSFTRAPGGWHSALSQEGESWQEQNRILGHEGKSLRTLLLPLLKLSPPNPPSALPQIEQGLTHLLLGRRISSHAQFGSIFHPLGSVYSLNSRPRWH